MKQELNSLQDAARYQLQRLYGIETRMREEFEVCATNVTSQEVQKEIRKYNEIVDSKLLKLERALSYLSEVPKVRDIRLISDLIAETHYLMDRTSSHYLRNILMISCLQNINSLKTSAYRAAYLFLVELELDTAADSIQEILNWELKTQDTLKDLLITEFNRSNANLKMS